MLNPFARSANPHTLVVGMVSVKMGDRFLQIGCAHGGRFGALAAQVGLSGDAMAVVPDPATAARAEKGAAQAGVLVDIKIAPPTHIANDDRVFDVAVIDDTDGLIGTMPADDRAAAIRELLRVLRPGGRVVVIGAGPTTGLKAMLSRTPSAVSAPGEAAATLTAEGFRSVRTLAEREGLVFVEGIKPR